MIEIPLDWLLAMILSVSLLVVFGMWILYTKDSARAMIAEMPVVSCRYCGYTFPPLNEDSLVRCPQCQAYLERETEGQKLNVGKVEK